MLLVYRRAATQQCSYTMMQTTQRCQIRPCLTVLAAVMCLLLLPGAVSAQQTDADVSVLVVPVANLTDSPTLDRVATTVAQTIDATVRLLGEFTVREFATDRIPTGVIGGEPDALRRFATAEGIDLVVFGQIVARGGAIDIGASVWDRAAGRITATETRTAPALLDIFAAADQVAVAFLSAFSGRTIAFGSIDIAPSGWSAGSYSIRIDGQEFARDATRVDNVLVGTRLVEIVAQNGPDAGRTVFRSELVIAQEQSAAIAFAIAAPASGPQPEQDSPPPQRTPPRLGVAPQQPEDTPWSRRTRNVTGRGPVTTVGLSYSPALYLPGDGFGPEALAGSIGVGPLTTLWAELEWPGGLLVGGAITGATTDYVERIDDQDAVDTLTALQNGAFALRLSDRLNLSLSVGRRVWQRHSRQLTFDLTPAGVIGISRTRQQLEATETTGTIAPGEKVRAGTREDEDDDGFRALLFGAKAVGRVSWRRLSLRLGLSIAYEQAIGADSSGNELLLFGDGTPTGIDLDAFTSGLVLGAEIGIGYAFGGRARR